MQPPGVTPPPPPWRRAATTRGVGTSHVVQRWGAGRFLLPPRCPSPIDGATEGDAPKAGRIWAPVGAPTTLIIPPLPALTGPNRPKTSGAMSWINHRQAQYTSSRAAPLSAAARTNRAQREPFVKARFETPASQIKRVNSLSESN